jgi:hypothetical protein
MNLIINETLSVVLPPLGVVRKAYGMHAKLRGGSLGAEGQ